VDFFFISGKFYKTSPRFRIGATKLIFQRRWHIRQWGDHLLWGVHRIVCDSQKGQLLHGMKMNASNLLPEAPKRVGIAADHGGYELKEFLAGKLRDAGYEAVDFGAGRPKEDDDYPDFIVPLARAVAAGKVERDVGICGSGVGASVCANKMAGVRACLIHENFSAHQGVEDDDLNLICFGGLVVGPALARELAQTSLTAKFSGAERHCRRLAKMTDLEHKPCAR
jgi:ribose 5-phosphate isomerase B